MEDFLVDSRFEDAGSDESLANFLEQCERFVLCVLKTFLASHDWGRHISLNCKSQ